jgi:tryptophanyl-tRNA synthetase
MEKKKVIVSGMRPTGKLHLGNYWGALKNYIELQDKYECYFFIADWHSLTTYSENSTSIKENTIAMVSDWLSAGLDANKCVIFRQSDVKYHAELYLLLGMITPISWLLRNPTFKEQLVELYRQKYKGQEDKMKKAEGSFAKIAENYGFTEEESMALNSELTNYGFLGYPVLQAADILLYGASHVPIGKDQLPHLELSREIARRFNHIFKTQVFIEPQAILTQSPYLPGIDSRKMSKSYKNVIELSDFGDRLEAKIKSMYTDPKKIRLNDKGNPDGCVVYAFHKLYNPESEKRAVECRSGSIGCGQCKKHLFNLMNPEMLKINENRNKYDKDMIEKILEAGKVKANSAAKNMMEKINKEVRLI